MPTSQKRLAINWPLSTMSGGSRSIGRKRADDDDSCSFSVPTMLLANDYL